jgi:hypothetical protein
MTAHSIDLALNSPGSSILRCFHLHCEETYLELCTSYYSFCSSRCKHMHFLSNAYLYHPEIRPRTTFSPSKRAFFHTQISRQTVTPSSGRHFLASRLLESTWLLSLWSSMLLSSRCIPGKRQRQRRSGSGRGRRGSGRRIRRTRRSNKVRLKRWVKPTDKMQPHHQVQEDMSLCEKGKFRARLCVEVSSCTS